MIYVEELFNQLKNIINNKKTKINVHFIVTEPLTSSCFEINKKVNQCNHGLLNLGIDYITLPHISLCSGYISDISALKTVFQIVDKYAKSIDCFSIDPTSIYFKESPTHKSKYLFVNLLQSDLLMHHKKQLDFLLRDIILPLDWNMPDEPAHITVGAFDSINDKSEKIIDSCKLLPSCKILQIGVSVVGKKGVCLGLLKSFDLKQQF